MTKKDLESVIDGLAELIGDWNHAAEDGDRGAANDAIGFVVFDDGSGFFGKCGFMGEVEKQFEFGTADELAVMLEAEGIIESVNHFTNIQGPQKCPRRCSQCPDGNHHWMIVSFPGCLDEEDDDYQEALVHPAVQAWIAAKENHPQTHEDSEQLSYFECKHCEAWHELTEAMLNDGEFEIV